MSVKLLPSIIIMFSDSTMTWICVQEKEKEKHKAL